MLAGTGVGGRLPRDTGRRSRTSGMYLNDGDGGEDRVLPRLRGRLKSVGCTAKGTQTAPGAAWC